MPPSAAASSAPAHSPAAAAHPAPSPPSAAAQKPQRHQPHRRVCCACRPPAPVVLTPARNRVADPSPAPERCTKIASTVASSSCPTSISNVGGRLARVRKSRKVRSSHGREPRADIARRAGNHRRYGGLDVGVSGITPVIPTSTNKTAPRTTGSPARISSLRNLRPCVSE